MRVLICATALEVCTAALGSRLRAIVLTGSLARDEATYSATHAGITFLSDADFLLVLDERAKDSSPAELSNLEEVVEARLLEETTISVHTGFATVFPRYFRGLRPTIFAHELKNHGLVIWGDVHILDLIPYFPESELSKEDAWRTLNHRIIEFISTISRSDFVARRSTAQLEYALIKLYLDMATSFLLFRDRYRPTYAARLEELSKPIVEYREPPRFDQETFCRRVSTCTARKLGHVRFRSDETATLFEEAITYGRELWFWETNLLCGSHGYRPVADVVAAMGHRQTYAEKQRAWISLVRRAGARAAAKHAPRWAQLRRLATPRYLIYGASFQLFCAVPERFMDINFSPDHFDPRGICDLLPIPPNEPGHTVNWATLATQANRCYQTFLIGTVS